MIEPQPSIDDWRQLYAVAVEFRKLKCWDWMLDSDVFGVQDPVSGEIGYCCVTGSLGSHFALVVYLGEAGLAAYEKAQSGRISPGDLEIFAEQNCTMASFEDSEALSSEDREIIKELELRFRGKNQWPLFRSYRIGCPPWYLTKEEAGFLTIALQQAVIMASRFKRNEKALVPPKEGFYLVRKPKEVDGNYQWTDEWIKPKPPGVKPKISIPPINEIRLQKIKKTIKRRSGLWETDFFYTPTPIKEGDERPRYPYAMLWVDSNSGLILNANMMSSDNYMTEYPNSLMELIETAKVKPGEIWVRKEMASELLNLIVTRLDIRLTLVERLKVLEEVQLSMFQLFQ